MPDEKKVAEKCVADNMSAGKIGEMAFVAGAAGAAGGASAGVVGAFVGATIGATSAAAVELGSQARATNDCINREMGRPRDDGGCTIS